MRNKNINLKKEAIAGITTFFTMAYIVLVNPSILATSGTGLSFNGVLTATVFLSFLMTLFMGLYANLPFAVAPGMGVNAFFAFTLILGQKVPWQTALGMVFWAGVLFLIVSLTSLRVSIAKAIPHHLRLATAGGIGIFLTFIGLKNAGLIVADEATFVRIGELNLSAVLSVLGLLLVVYFLKRKSPFAFLFGIFFISILSWILGLMHLPPTYFSKPDFSSVFFKLDFWSPLQFMYLPAILSILFTDLFDSVATFVGVSQSTGLLDKNGEPKNLKQGLLVDAVATMSAGLFGTSSGTAYIESTAGVEAGGRTGWTSIFTALCFLPCFFIAPLAQAIPTFATAPVLILIGCLMFKSVYELKSEKLEEIVPSFFTIVFIPLTFSITQGILWGFVLHTILFLLVGRKKEISLMMYGLAVLSGCLIFLDKIKAFLI